MDNAPKDGDEMEVRDAQGREALAWWSAKDEMFRSGGIHHGSPIIGALDAHPWVEWRRAPIWRIGRA